MNIPRHFEDSLAPFELVAKNGYYSVGDRLFCWKPTALAAASQSRQPARWHFHDHIWRQTGWRTCSLSLPQLYRMRAEQLRQKYDYLMLAWSGGADSTAILDTFIENHIPLDEVIIAWAHKIAQGRYRPNDADTTPENFLSEWDYAVKPKIEWLRRHRPEIRVTVCDWSDELAIEPDHEHVLKIANAQSYTGMLRSKVIDDAIRERSDVFNRVALITGTSPANVSIVNHEYLAVHFDDGFGESKSDFMMDGTVRNVEFFYWTPDLPEIVGAQCREVKNFLEAYPMARRFFYNHQVNRKGEMQGFDQKEQIDVTRLMKKILFYPSYDPRTFQAKKHPDRGRPEHYNWLYQHAHSIEYSEPFYCVLENYNRLIDPDFFYTDRPRDYKLMWTGLNIMGKFCEPQHNSGQDGAAWRMFNRLLPWYQ